MNVLLADEPITQSKLPTTKILSSRNRVHSAQKYHCSLWANSGVKKYVVGWCQIKAISATN